MMKSNKAFVQKVQEEMPFTGTSKEKTAEMAKSIYETQKKRQEEHSAELAKAYEEARAAKGVSGEVSRMYNGSLRVEKEDLGENGELGGRDYSYDTGAAERSATTGVAEKYGHIEVNESDNGITILAADFLEDKAGLIDELMGEIAARNPGKKIVLSEEAEANPFIAGAYERYQESKEFYDTPTSVADMSMKNVHRQQFLDMGHSPGQAEATIGMMQTFANAAGTTYSKFWAQLKGVQKAVFKGKNADNILGYAAFYDNGKEIFPDDVKKLVDSVIYLAEHEASVGVLTHELTHVARVQMSVLAPQALADIEAEYGITDGVWSKDNDERFADEYTAFLDGGEVANEKAKSFFVKVKELIQKMMPYIGKVMVGERVKKVFDKWYAAPIVTEATTTTETEGSQAEGRAGDETDAQFEKEHGLKPGDLAGKPEEFGTSDLIDNEEDRKIFEESLELFSDDKGLHMSKEDFKAHAEEFNARMSAEAADYDSVEEWVEKGIGYKYDSLKESDKVWFKARFDYFKANKPPLFPNHGDFTKMLFNGRNLTDFLYALDRAISKAGMMADTRRAKRIRDSISKSPLLVEAMDSLIKTGDLLSDNKMKQLRSYVRENEEIVMFLYAEVSGDQDMAQEALSNLKELPEMHKIDFVQRPGMTLADQAYLLRAIRNGQLRERLMSGQATVGEIRAYEKAIIKEGQDALKAQRDQITDTLTERYEERIALMKMRQQMHKLRKYILSPPGARLDNTYLKMLMLLKQYLKNGQKLSTKELPALASIVFKEHPEYGKSIIGLVDRVGKKNFKDWTLEELNELSDIMRSLNDIGRMLYDQKKHIHGVELKEKRSRILAAVRSSERYAKNVAKAGGAIISQNTQEAMTDRRNSSHMLTRLISAGRADGVFNHYDHTGTIKKILWDSAIEGKRQEYENIDRRTEKIKQFIKEKGLYKDMDLKVDIHGVDPDNKLTTVTKGQLLGIRALIGNGDRYNQIQRERVVYGLMFSSDFKEKGDDQEMVRLYEDKLKILEDTFDAYLTPDEEELVEMMVKEFNDSDEWIRFAHAMLDLSGKEMTNEGYYFPIRQSTKLVEGDDSVTDAIVRADKFFGSLMEDGFCHDRERHIKPSKTKPIQCDIFELFFGGIERQEHLINLGSWAKDMKGIFSHPTFSESLDASLRVLGGPELQDYIGNFIDKTINPNGFKVRGDGSEIMKTVRGKVMICMLAWRVSTFLVQFATSPLITLAYAPKQFFRTIIKAYGSGNPIKWYQEIEAKSAVLRNRQLDPVIAKIKQLYEEGKLTKAQQAFEFGFRFLNFADRFSVAIQWESVYQKYADIRDEKGDPVYSLDEAANKADEVILQSQPTSEDMFRSPLYSNMTSWKAIVLQFTQPLNVIWNQLVYDVPQALREREMYRFFATIMCYALSGLAIGAVKALPVVGGSGGPDKEDDDEDMMLRYWLSYMTSQFTDTIPLVGPFASAVAKYAITGKRPLMSSTNAPLADSVMDIGLDLVSIARNGGATPTQFANVTKNTFIALGTSIGAPGLAIGDPLSKLIKEYDTE